MTIQEPLDSGSLLHRIALFSQQIRARSGDSLALDPLYIPALITPMQTPGADGGLNDAALSQHADGLLVLVQPYSNMRAGDWVDVYWGDDAASAASGLVLEEHIGASFALFVNASKIPEGLHKVHYTVTRSGSGNKELSLELQILVRRAQPGGTDPEPDLPGHQNLAPPAPELPPSGIIDEEAARNGVKVSIAPYPNMREYDRITLSWGGELVTHAVKAAEVGQAVEIIVPEAVILKAGDSDELVLVYRVMDEVHNQSSDWSPRSHVMVEVDGSRPDAPLIVNPDDNADPYDVIDLDKLGDDDLPVEVIVVRDGGIAVGDSVTLTWVGTTAQGQEISYTSEPQNVQRIPAVLSFEVPNADVRGLGHGRGVAAYKVSRSDGSDVTSKRAFVSFIGVEQQLPKPTVSEAVGGSLDPDLPQATVVVPGAALQASDMVEFTWLGIQASGSPLLYTARRPVSSGGTGSPLVFTVLADYLKPLDGGRLEVYYEILRSGLDAPLKSEREHLQVGEAQHALPAPGVTPPASDGWLDPDLLPNGVDVVIAPYANMRVGQTVHMEWRATVGSGTSDFMAINEFLVGHPLPFGIGQAQLQENAEGEVEVWYRVEEPGQPTRRSQSLHLKIGKEQEEDAPLIAPVVLEAVDGLLDPLKGATVRVSYADMVPEDILAITWGFVGEKPLYDSTQQPGSTQGYVDFPVPADVLQASDGHGIQVFYARVRKGQSRLSEELRLVVMEIPPEGLPTPVIVQAKEGGLDLTSFNGNADVTVEPWQEIAVGQYYWLRAYGTKQDGTAHTIDLAVGQTVTAADIAGGLKLVLARSELILLGNYSELRVELKVALSGGSNEDLATRFPLLVVTVRVEKRTIHESFNDLPPQKINYLESINTSTMTITLFTPSSWAEVIQVSGNQPHMDGMLLSSVIAISMALKFQCRAVEFSATYHPWYPTICSFYNAQGLEIGRFRQQSGSAGGSFRYTYTAPPGQFFSTMVMETSGTGAYLDNLIFEL